MAARKETKTKVPRKNESAPPGEGGKKKPPVKGAEKHPVSWAVLFWLAFAIFIFGLFLFNRETIARSIEIIRNEAEANKAAAGEGAETAAPQVSPAPAVPGAAEAPQARTEPGTAGTAPSPPEEPAVQKPPEAAATPAASAVGVPPAQTEPPGQPGPGAAPQPGESTSEQRPAEERDRTLYLIQVDRGGSIFGVGINRKLPVSESPLTDTLQALIAGPSADEKKKGLISLIPPATRILSATVRGSTAYISFSEDFQYNTYGVEGYAGQLRQIVFTVTEFLNVNDVQILIEGRRLDYLGEGIWIGSPLNREML